MATINDIAARAGVTVTTVSRVMNNRGYISDLTREKVNAAIRELDYKPNEVARALLRRSTRLLGVIIPDVAHPFFGELVSCMEAHAHAYGYKLLLCDSQMDKVKEQEYIQMLQAHQVEGILMGSHTQETDAYLQLGLPLVSLERSLDPGIPYVASDNEAGGRLAATHLIERGCRNLGCVFGGMNRPMLANHRYEAFAACCRELDVPQKLFPVTHDLLPRYPHAEELQPFLEENPQLDGLFCSSDVLAMAAITALKRLGRKVPGDVRVMGYDDSVLASQTPIALSTIRQPVAEMARTAVEVLMTQIQGKDAPERVVLPVELMIRETA